MLLKQSLPEPAPPDQELQPEGLAKPTLTPEVEQSTEAFKKRTDHCPKSPDPEVWENIAAMGERLGISAFTFRRMCRNGHLGPEGGLRVKPGCAMWFDAVAVEAHLVKDKQQEHVVEPEDTAPAELDRLLAEVRRLTDTNPELRDQLLGKAEA